MIDETILNDFAESFKSIEAGEASRDTPEWMYFDDPIEVIWFPEVDPTVGRDQVIIRVGGKYRVVGTSDKDEHYNQFPAFDTPAEVLMFYKVSNDGKSLLPVQP